MVDYDYALGSDIPIIIYSVHILLNSHIVHI